MGQTRLGSLVESWTNTAIGYVINVLAGLVIYPMFGASFSLLDNMGIGLVFTAISIVRGYAIRRWFNHMLLKARMS